MAKEIDDYFAPWLAARVLAEYELPLQAEPKHQGHGAKLATRAFQDTVAKLIEEACEVQPQPGKAFGLRLVCIGKVRADLTNMAKALEDGMNRRAFHDDRDIFYSQHMKVPGDPARILIQVVLP